MNTAARQQFLSDYARIRHAEGRGSADASYYRELPDRDLTGNNSAQWKIRACSFRHFERTILADVERRLKRELDVLDVGAGNGWMSYRLARRRHRVTALDIFRDDQDGLGALTHYPINIPAVVADFDHPPFRDAAFDLAIFNASFHYSPNYHKTLAQIGRCLRPSGLIVIMDSPLYERHEHGEMMRAERQALFEQHYGFRSDALGSVEYLDHGMLEQLSLDLGIEWRHSKPWYGLKWALRPWKAKLQRRRPPSRFVILTGSFRRG
jgi:SAM-dependent methyltransferase